MQPMLLLAPAVRTQALGWVTPGFLQPARTWVEGTAAWWLTPPLNAVINVLHGAVALADDVVRAAEGSSQSPHAIDAHGLWCCMSTHAKLLLADDVVRAVARAHMACCGVRMRRRVACACAYVS